MYFTTNSKLESIDLKKVGAGGVVRMPKICIIHSYGKCECGEYHAKPRKKMINENERIICSAIWYKDFPTATFLPTNIKKGIVIGGHRHGHCLHTMVALTGKRQSEVGEHVQGFLTNLNRFVDRQEGMQIHLNTVGKSFNNLSTYGEGGDLFSEDLY